MPAIDECEVNPDSHLFEFWKRLVRRQFEKVSLAEMAGSFEIQKADALPFGRLKWVDDNMPGTGVEPVANAQRGNTKGQTNFQAYRGHDVGDDGAQEVLFFSDHMAVQGD